jgi:hypothetical protein
MAVNVADIVRTRKSELETGTWRSGHIPRGQFPLSKAKSKNYKFGPEYKWRVIRFECRGVYCRILLLLNEGKQIFRATLGVEIE